MTGCHSCSQPATDKQHEDAASPNNPVVELMLGLRDASADSDAGADAGPTSAAPLPPPLGLEESRCRLAWGPVRLPFRGPGILRTAPGRLDVTFHEHGQLRVHRIDYAKPAAKPPKVAPMPGEVAMSFPACAAAFAVGGRDAKSVYCPGDNGAVVLTKLGAPTPKIVATGLPSESLAAAAFGPEHSVVAYLDRRVVAGEATLEAFAVLDEGPPVRISEEGAGATSVTLTALNDREVLALMIDARSALSAVHARVLRYDGAALMPEPDTIVHVGASERGSDAAVARFADGTLVALLPQPTGITQYGIIGLRLPLPLQMDLQGELFPYPKGLEFARVATANVGPKVYAALTRTRDASRDALAVLELTEVQRNGALMPLGIVAEGVPMLDLDITADEFGALWLLYGDGKGSLLERRVCP